MQPPEHVASQPQTCTPGPHPHRHMGHKNHGTHPSDKPRGITKKTPWHPNLEAVLTDVGWGWLPAFTIVSVRQSGVEMESDIVFEN